MFWSSKKACRSSEENDRQAIRTNKPLRTHLCNQDYNNNLGSDFITDSGEVSICL
jgi:hypothetical protein